MNKVLATLIAGLISVGAFAQATPATPAAPAVVATPAKAEVKKDVKKEVKADKAAVKKVKHVKKAAAPKKVDTKVEATK